MGKECPPFQELLNIDRQTEIYSFVTDRNVLQITDGTQEHSSVETFSKSRTFYLMYWHSYMLQQG